MRKHTELFLAGLLSLTSAACHLQTEEDFPSTEKTEEDSSCAEGTDCEEQLNHERSGAEEGAEEHSAAEEPGSCSACEPNEGECGPTTGTSCEEGSEAEELEFVLARPLVVEEPVLANFCGVNPEKTFRSTTSCESLKLDCKSAGGTFLCHDEESSDECKTWGGCHFFNLQAVQLGSEPLPEGLGKSSGDEGGLADTSEFGCGESKGCCLFVPGAGDGVSDCGGFLASCELIGCTPSGGNHVASCQC